MPKSLTPLVRPPLHGMVSERLETAIIKGDFQPGEQLPSEAELARQLGVGRRAVRESLRVLEAKGLVEIRNGVGIFAIRRDFDTYLRSLQDNIRSYLAGHQAEVAHLSQFRELIEGGAVERLCAARSGEPVARLQETVAEQREAVDAGDTNGYDRAHAAFHRTIVDSLDNPVISMFFQQVYALLRSRMSESGARPGMAAAAIEEHTAILDAVTAGNARTARQHLLDHLAHSRRNLEELA